MIVNDHTITAKEFAWDECHKIYLINSEEDREKLIGYGYNLYPIKGLKKAYESSCMLKFIQDAFDFRDIVGQGEKAEFSRR